MRIRALAITVALVAVACTSESEPADDSASEGGSVVQPNSTEPVLVDGSPIPPPPPIPTGPLAAEVVADIDAVYSTLTTGVDLEALDRIGEADDLRVAWILADLLRFFPGGLVRDGAVGGYERLSGYALGVGPAWNLVTDILIAWDVPAPPGYTEWKRQLFTIVEPAWAPFFADEDADIDWRHLSWGGVLIDDRPIEEVALPCPEGCIPALDDPALTDAAGGDWYPDDRIVFGIVLNGEARAYPKNIMEVHEMVNDTLGGRRIGVPYCTLCGSAQAYLTDRVPDGFETLELRTSGLLSRSNKVMFDLHTFSIFDTFLGVALSGPLREAGVELEQVSVVTSTWADWKAAHPDTTIVAEDGGLDRSYPLDPLRGRDDNGPIFPIGDVDPRLPVQEQVLGVLARDGTPVAFPVDAATRAIEAGESVELEGIVVLTDGAGLIAEFADGTSVASHQAFWFAWSQFQPNTLVWTPLG